MNSLPMIILLQYVSAHISGGFNFRFNRNGDLAALFDCLTERKKNEAARPYCIHANIVAQTQKPVIGCETNEQTRHILLILLCHSKISV